MSYTLPYKSQPKRDMFYNPKQFQQFPDFDWTKTPVISGPSGYLEQNQDVTYNRFLNNMGFGQADQSPYAQWLRRQFQDTQLGFKSALAENPTTSYQSYLQQLDPRGFWRRWIGMTPEQRGENPSRYGGPIRTIADL